MFEMIQSFDWSVLHWIQDSMQSEVMDFLMPKITMLGDAGILWILIAVIMLFFKKYRKNGLLLGIGLLIGVIIGNLILKNIIARDRPCWIEASFPLLLENPDDYSFPSGHTLASAIAATMLTITNRKFGIVVIPLAAVIAFSRLYLYVHFPSDVIFAAILGIAIGILTYVIGSKITKKIFAKTNNEIE